MRSGNRCNNQLTGVEGFVVEVVVFVDGTVVEVASYVVSLTTGTVGCSVSTGTILVGS